MLACVAAWPSSDPLCYRGCTMYQTMLYAYANLSSRPTLQQAECLRSASLSGNTSSALDVLQCKITIVSWSCTGTQKDCAFKTSCCAMGLQNTIGTTKACSHRAPTADPRGTIPLLTCMTQQCLLHIPFRTFLYSLSEATVCALIICSIQHCEGTPKPFHSIFW